MASGKSFRFKLTLQQQKQLEEAIGVRFTTLDLSIDKFQERIGGAITTATFTGKRGNSALTITKGAFSQNTISGRGGFAQGTLAGRGGTSKGF